MNNNSTRLPLLPPAPFATSLCSKRKWESFFKLSQRNALPVFETGLFNDSDKDERFYGFRAQDIVLREAVADSDFNVYEVSSVHTSDWSKWEQWWLGQRYRENEQKVTHFSCTCDLEWSSRSSKLVSNNTLKNTVSIIMEIWKKSICKHQGFYHLFFFF